MIKFLIIGAMKAGTTSLHHCLAQHPDLTPARRKEVHYFDGRVMRGRNNYERGPDWYEAQFPEGPNKFESSPMYLFNPLVARRIKEYNPDMKILVLLRDPVKRAVSHYYHSVRKGHERLSMLEAFQKEEERLNGVSCESKPYQWFSYKRRGNYALQLKRYRQAGFDPRVYSSEQFFADSQGVTNDVFKWLEVEPMEVDTTPKNMGLPEVVDPEAEEYLKEYFAQWQEALKIELNRAIMVPQ